MDSVKVLGAFYLHKDGRLIWESVPDGSMETLKSQLSQDYVIKSWIFPRKMPENPTEFITQFLVEAKASGAPEADLLRIAERNKIQNWA